MFSKFYKQHNTQLDCTLSRCQLAPCALVAMYGLLVRQQSAPCYLYKVTLVDGDVTMYVCNKYLIHKHERTHATERSTWALCWRK